MASKEHIRILGNSVVSMSMREWNQWRMENPQVLPDLSGEDFSRTDMDFINLSNTDLRYTDLSGSSLHHANLRKADLSRAKICGANLSRADLSYANLRKADLSGADLRDAILRGANLQGANLDDIHIKRADLTDALLDPGALENPQNWFASGISRIEKIALGLFVRKTAYKKPGASPSAGTGDEVSPPAKPM